jgi:glycosyltransferase involved in cell wall biosynthesis
MHLAINAWFWDQPTTGSGQTVRYLLPALLEADPTLEATLIAPPWVTADPVPLPPRARWHTASGRRGHVGKVWFEQVEFPRICRQIGADIAHVPYFGSPLRPSAPTVVTIHDLIPMVLPAYRGGAAVRLYTALAATSARSAARILTDSQASQQDVLTWLYLRADRAQVVYLAQAPFYHPAAPDEQAAVRQKYQLPEEFILWLSGFDVRKNARTLLQAYTWVQESLGDAYPLVMAGGLPAADSPFFPDPRSIAAELGVSDVVHFPGRVDEADKPALYSAAAAFVYPSRYEGFGLPVLEAMACGTPAVTSDAASLPEIVGSAAFTLAPDDARGMAAAIIALCTDTALHQSMRQAGLRQAAKFSWARTAQETLAVYRQVLVDDSYPNPPLPEL